MEGSEEGSEERKWIEILILSAGGVGWAEGLQQRICLQQASKPALGKPRNRAEAR